MQYARILSEDIQILSHGTRSIKKSSLIERRGGREPRYPAAD